MNILLDTNVVSEWQKNSPAEPVVRFGDQFKREFSAISVMTIAEIGYGINRLSEGRERVELEAWLAGIETAFEHRIMPIDFDTAKIWSQLVARLHGNGRNIKSPDAWIAATAVQHELQLATRNIRDFSETGIVLINPWEF